MDESPSGMSLPQDSTPPASSTQADWVPTDAVIAVSVGDGSACGLTATGEVECWGVQLGGESSLAAPATVTGLPSEVKSVSVGFDSACAVTAGGGVLLQREGIDGLRPK